jgi:hypothetical protein
MIVMTGFVWYGRPMVAKLIFESEQLNSVNQAVALAEELVSNHYKMSTSQWLRPRFDIKTLADLSPNEVVEGPFAQIIRYEGKRKGSPLGSDSYDFYKICLQDHTILRTLSGSPGMLLLPFLVYILTHELIHIVRFSKFLQIFEASADEKLAEERRVHNTTHQILNPIRLEGLDAVLDYFRLWRLPIETTRKP